MRRRFKASIKGKKYTIAIESPQPGDYATLDYIDRRVSVDPSVNLRDARFRVEILLHEAIHVLAPEWGEKRVLRAGKDLSRLLKTAGEIV